MPPISLPLHLRHHEIHRAREKMNSRTKRSIYLVPQQNISYAHQTFNTAYNNLIPEEYYEDTPNSADDITVYDDNVSGYDDIGSDSTTQSTHDQSLPGHRYTVQPEEIGIVIGILLLWIGAIALFFNRWGKIRMLEPYQPKFCEEHRPSCPISEPPSVPTHFPRSFSRMNSLAEENPNFAKCRGTSGACGYMAIGGLPSRNYGIPTGIMNTSNYAAAATKAYRQRQNSIFTSTPHSGVFAMNHIQRNASRRTKSVFDLPSLVLSEEFFETLRRSTGKNAISHV